MRIIDIKEENVSLFLNYLGKDRAENMHRSFYRCIVVENDREEPIAGMMWEMTGLDEESPVESHIFWISIEDEEAGEELLKSYRRKVSAEGAVLSKASVYIKRNSLENRLLKKHGFPLKLTEGDHITLRLSELSEMPIMKNRKLSDKVKPLCDVSVRTYRNFISNLLDKGKKGLCEDIRYVPMSWFENEVSCCYEDEEGVNGMLLFHMAPSGSLMLKLSSVEGKDKKEMGIRLQLLIRQAVLYAEELYPPSTRVIVERHNETALLISEKLFPRGFGRPVYVGERKEEPVIKPEETDDLTLFKLS